MTDEAFIKELAAMQKDLQEMRRGLGIAQTRYNHLNYRVNQMKRRISASLRKEKAQAQPTTNPVNENQTSLKFDKNNV